MHTQTAHTATLRLAAHTHKIYAHTQQEKQWKSEGDRESHAERELEQSLPRIYQPKTMQCFFFFFFAKYPIIAAYAIETGSK